MAPTQEGKPAEFFVGGGSGGSSGLNVQDPAAARRGGGGGRGAADRIMEGHARGVPDGASQR